MGKCVIKAGVDFYTFLQTTLLVEGSGDINMKLVKKYFSIYCEKKEYNFKKNDDRFYNYSVWFKGKANEIYTEEEFNEIFDIVEDIKCGSSSLGGISTGQVFKYNSLEDGSICEGGNGGSFYTQIPDNTPQYKDTGAELTKTMFENAGLDIQSFEDITIPAKGSALIKTNLFLKIPKGCVGLIWSRSGLSVKNKLEVGAGCIDSNYRGEVKVHLYNFSDTDFVVKKGDRIAQLLTIPVLLDYYKIVANLGDTDRGENGFGSSGV